jgi:hypothetical protein
MNHMEWKEQIGLLMDNELPEASTPLLFGHLAECIECRHYFLRSQTIHNAAQRLERAPVPEALDKKFGVLSMGAQPQKTPERTITLSVPSLVYSLGTMVMLTFFIYLLGSLQEKSLAAQYRHSMSGPGAYQQSSSQMN